MDAFASHRGRVSGDASQKLLNLFLCYLSIAQNDSRTNILYTMIAVFLAEVYSRGSASRCVHTLYLEAH